LSPQDRAAFERRVSELDKRIDAAKSDGKHGPRPQPSSAGGRGMAYGLRMASELVGAIIVGCLIGYGLDAWLGTRPWFFLAFFFIGFAAGVLNVMRGYQRYEREMASDAAGAQKRPGEGN
jgi:ATP synthase protein I